ncbi:hypothetical protein HPP92_026021 [Vanilla planifolia]|uniref:Uncharacterized protein n=1 Tax=Vanilla planifolia TaxID=51239 RepID=A0A835U7Y3_VANPL|nr:hypothetical protein HPP92_026298 [Vanilla planifolia]KAG0451763.1 hypothetical protein HPP92_026021 [Vanilla planifolia]
MLGHPGGTPGPFSPPDNRRRPENEAMQISCCGRTHRGFAGDVVAADEYGEGDKREDGKGGDGGGWRGWQVGEEGDEGSGDI